MDEKRKEERTEVRRDHPGDEIDPQELGRVIWRRRRFIAVVTGAVTILTLVVSFLLTPIFRSKAVILPINKAMPSLFEGSDLSSLIGILGLEGGSSSSKIMAILTSNTIKERILEKHELMKVIFEDEWDQKREKWKGEPPHIWEGIRALDKMVEIETERKTGVVIISSDFKDPLVAANISKWYIDELRAILKEKSFSMARHYRENIEKIIASLDGQLKIPAGDLPDFTLFMQKMRDITISEKAYEELLVQYYVAKFQEAREDVIFQVIDEAKAPDKPVKPKKLLNTFLAMIISLFLTSFYVVVFDREKD